MKAHRRILALLLVTLASGARAQQEPDLDYQPPLPQPAYAPGAGPRVAIDEAHHNYHTAGGRYAPFAALLRRDGYRVDGLGQPFSPETLHGLAVLVIANPLHPRNVKDWSLPTPSAFTAAEIAAVRDWVDAGGALFLIVDHLPFPGAAGDLARAFGIEFSNGFAVAKRAGQPTTFVFPLGKGLAPGAITQGRNDRERVTQVLTFVGSAFKAPRDAVPVLQLNNDFVSLKPTTAWKFTASTPREPLDGWCQGAVMDFGRGRIAVFGEAAMFSAQLAGPGHEKVGMNAPEASQNHQLLLNVLHWLTRVPGMPD